MKTIINNQKGMVIKHHKMNLFTSSKRIRLSELTVNSITLKA